MAMVRFGDVAERVNTKEDRFNTDLTYYVGGDHIETNELRVTGRGVIKEADLGPMFYFGFKPGDILFVTRNPHLRKSAKVDFSGICSEKTLVIATKDENVLLQDYLVGVMQSDDFWDFMEENKSGSVNYFINWSTLADYEFDLPPLARQKELAELLWAANDLKESYKKMIAATDEMLKAKFREMFGDGAPDELQWEHRRAADVFDISSSRRVLKNDWVGTGVPFLRVRDMVGMANGEALQNEFFVSRKYYDALKDEDGKVCAGDILISATSTIGKCYVVRDGEEFYYKDADILRYRKRIDIDSEYYIYALQMPTLRDQIMLTVGGTTVGHFLICKAKEIQIPLPPLALQQQFVEIARKADETKVALKKSITDVEQVIKGLING